MIAVAIVIFNFVVLYVVIQSVTKSYKRRHLQVATLYMPAKIAKKQGVEEQEIDDLPEWAKSALM